MCDKCCRFPGLFTLHCTAHALDLALERICELPYFCEPIAVGKKIIQILTNHHYTSALFKAHSTLFLLKPGDTRFYSAYIALRRLLRCHSAVQKTVVSDEWKEWAAKRDYKEKNYSQILNACYTSMHCMWHFMTLLQVYPECCAIEKHIESTKLPEDTKQDVASIFRERWDKMHSPLHSVGYMLEPQFQDADFGLEVS